MIQAFGPEARGSSTSAQLIVSDELITYPYITAPNLMVLMSQEAYTKFSSELVSGGTLITEEELVTPHNLRKDVYHFSIPATRFAEELGKKMVLNIVMMGFTTAISNVVIEQAMIDAVKVSVPKGTEELNLKAFQMGYEYGKIFGRKACALHKWKLLAAKKWKKDYYYFGKTVIFQINQEEVPFPF
jgi:2-oxoglutarate ferredoxin oxidoreductase subunit gamma